MAPSPASRDSSRELVTREMTKFQKELLPPFYLVTSFGLLTHKDFKQSIINDILKSNDLVRFNELLNDPYRGFKLLTHGRPLWGSYYESTFASYKKHNNSDDIAMKLAVTDLISMASLKLFGSTSFDTFHGDAHFLASMACFGVLLGVPINGDKPQAKALLSSHGAWLKFVSTNAQWLQLGYYSEPALVQVALSAQVDYMAKLQNALYKALYDKFVDAGTKGELIAAQLLLSARHAATIVRHDGTFDRRSTLIVGTRVTLYNFLKQLGVHGIDDIGDFENLASLGESGIESSRELLEKLYVNFTHFVHVRTVPNMKMMRNAAVYGEAFILKQGQSGADIGIVYFNENGNIGIMYVQVKNYGQSTADKNYDQVVTQKLSLPYIYENILPSFYPRALRSKSVPAVSFIPDYLDLQTIIPYMGLYMQMGPGKRDSMKRNLVALPDHSLRACLMLHDEDALPCLQLYGEGFDFKNNFLQLAMNQAVTNDRKPDNVSDETMILALAHFEPTCFRGDDVPVRLHENDDGAGNILEKLNKSKILKVNEPFEAAVTDNDESDELSVESEDEPGKKKSQRQRGSKMPASKRKRTH